MKHRLDEAELPTKHKDDKIPKTTGTSPRQSPESHPQTNASAGPSIDNAAPSKEGWRKLGGKDNNLNRIVIPEGVEIGKIAREFPTTLRWDKSKGLQNLHNSCYRNALLQCLLHVPQFYNYLGNVHHDCPKENNKCTTCALQRLTHAYWAMGRTHNTSIELGRLVRDLRDALRTDIAKKPGTDALNLSMDEFPGHLIRKEIHSTMQCDAFDFAKGLEEVLRYQARDDPVFAAMHSQTLQLRWKKSWICKKCRTHNVPDNDESDMVRLGLEVSIMDPKRGLSLTEYLRANVFNTSNPYSCSSAACQALRKKTGQSPINVMRSQITSAPEILVVLISRISPAYKKVEDPVVYEEHLDLGEYTIDSSALDYRLDGVVYHAGEGIKSGHFEAGVRTRAKFDDFRAISDSIIDPNKYSVGFALEDYGDGKWGKFVPYVLVYSKFDRVEEEEGNEDGGDEEEGVQEEGEEEDVIQGQ